MQTTYYDEATDSDIEVEIDGSMSKRKPARMYLKNGDPGYPEEGGELEDFSICLPDGTDITNTVPKEVYESLFETLAIELADEDEYYDR
jgi:hypothetical protein